MTKRHDCIIGEYISYDSHLVTVADLYREIAGTKAFNESLEVDAKAYEADGRAYLADELRKYKRTEYGINNFCDRRRKAPLHRFEYCPICGKKIKWGDMHD